MSVNIAQSGLAELLTRAGAQPPRHGRKWDCPACGGKACLSVDESRGLFNCFHDGCNFKGNTATLARRLGLALPRVSPVEYRRRQERERRLDERVSRILEAKCERRNVILDTLAHLYHSEITAHTAGPNNPQAWDALATSYRERLRLEAELLILDNASGRDLERFLGLSGQSVKGDKDTAIGNVIMQGGMYDKQGRFVELHTESIAGAISGRGLCSPSQIPP